MEGCTTGIAFGVECGYCKVESIFQLSPRFSSNCTSDVDSFPLRVNPLRLIPVFKFDACFDSSVTIRCFSSGLERYGCFVLANVRTWEGIEHCLTFCQGNTDKASSATNLLR